MKKKQSAEKRERILRSPAFQAWWRQRREVFPVPKDPYQAYMTDLGLEARLHGKKPWMKEPHRFDVEPVDFPVSPPGRRPKVPKSYLEREIPGKRVRKLGPVGLALQSQVERWSQLRGVPVPQIVEHRIAPLKSGYLSLYVPSTHQYIGGRIHIGVKGSKTEGGKVLVTEQIMATLTHEFGHHEHATMEALKTGKITEGYILHLPSREQVLEREQRAWSLAEQLRKTAPQAWLKSYALSTYRGVRYPRKEYLEP